MSGGPELLGGRGKAIFQAIQKTDPDVHSVLFETVVLVGKAAQYVEQVTQELTSLAGQDVDVVAVEDTHAAWRGGSIMASLDSFQSMWISRAQFDQEGPAVVNKML